MQNPLFTKAGGFFIRLGQVGAADDFTLRNIALSRRYYFVMIKRILYCVPIAMVWLNRWIRAEKERLLLRFFYKGPIRSVKIIVAHFDGYPLYREKEVFTSRISCGIGRLFDRMLQFRAGVPYEVILVVNLHNGADRLQKQEYYRQIQKKYTFIEKVILRGNSGFDYGGYNDGFRYLKESGFCGDVVFMNSSVRGPYCHAWLLSYQYLLYSAKNIGLCGISMNSHATHLPLEKQSFAPHVQGFFLYTTMGIAREVYGDSLPGADTPMGDKERNITEGELGFSSKMLEKGFGIRCKLFRDFIYYQGGTWDIPEGDHRYNELYQQFANKL